MPIDVTENYIRIRIADTSDFQPESYRTIDIDADKGIKSTIGKLKSETKTTTLNFMFDKTQWSTEEAKSWVLDHGKKIMNELSEFSDNKKTFDLNDVEIFASGNWRNGKAVFTDNDLENLIENFNKLSDLKAPLKLGHTDKQKIAQNGGLPALGYVTKLWRAENKLLANFSEIPKQIMELIKRKAYGRFSVEIMRNYTYRGNQYGNVLTAVALLGDELPAVQTIKDILDLYGETKPATCFETAEAEIFRAYELPTGKESEKMNELEQLKTLMAEQQAKVATLETEKNKLAEENTRFSEATEAAQKNEAKTKIDVIVEKGVTDFKISPAMRPFLLAMSYKMAGLAEEKYKFTEDGKETELNFSDVSEVLEKMSEALPKILDPKEKSEATKTDKKENESEDEKEGTKTFSTGKELDTKVKKIMVEQKLTYSEAFDIALDEQEGE